MTTDVINGVPRSLLERCVLLAQDAMGVDFDEHAAIERDIYALLSEQPQADHSAQDLNMVEQPQAGAGKSALNRAVYLCSESGPRFKLTVGFASLADLQAAHDQVSHAIATAQPAARNDQDNEVRRLREALERVKLTEKEARHHSVSTVAYWNNAVTACISVLVAQGGEVGK